MIDFNKINSPEYQQRKKEREEQERLDQELCEHTACFTGHRPQSLSMFGFDMKHPGYDSLKKSLNEAIELCITKENIKRFLSGGAQGVDQISYWCVHKLKSKYPHVKNVVAVPFKNQHIKWTNQDSIKWYFKMLERADEVIYVDELNDYRYCVNEVEIGTYHIAKMSKRNEYMVDESEIVIAVYDGSKKGGTRNCYNYACKKCKRIYRINPNFNFKLEIY